MLNNKIFKLSNSKYLFLIYKLSSKNYSFQMRELDNAKDSSVQCVINVKLIEKQDFSSLYPRYKKLFEIRISITVNLV